MGKTIKAILRKRKLLRQFDVFQNLIHDATFTSFTTQLRTELHHRKSDRNCVSKKFVMESLRGL